MIKSDETAKTSRTVADADSGQLAAFPNCADSESRHKDQKDTQAGFCIHSHRPINKQHL